MGVDVARPFVGNLNAPASSVGIYGADACATFGTGSEPFCDSSVANKLISLNALRNSNSTVVQVTNKDVRYIINAATSQGVFGTPFGAARNLSTDAITNIGNFSVFKKFNLTERTSFEFHATLLNVFNHPNFQSIDPFIEDAGVTPAPGTGFGDPTVTNDIIGNALGNRRVIFGGTIRF